MKVLMQKSLGFLLAIIMMFSAFSFSAFSAYDTEDGTTDNSGETEIVTTEAVNQKVIEEIGEIQNAAIPTAATASQTSEVWDGSIAEGFESGIGTEEDPYIIKTAAQLAYLASSTNSGTTYSGKYLKLEADILLNDTTDWETWGTEDGDGNVIAPANTWTAIGMDSKFYGSFDGNNHTVSGIYINNTSDYQGLFGYAEDATIKNIGVTDSYIKGKVYVGGVVGYVFYSGIVTNCYNTGTVSGDSHVGGVVGDSGNGTVTNCYNTGTVSGTSIFVGGIAGCGGRTVIDCYNMGAVSGTGSNSYVGGVVGICYYGTVTNCYNTGSVGGISYVGGVVGCVESSTVTNCYNTGSVGVTDSGVGGVVGICHSNGTVTNCYNTGTVSGTSNVGGVVGDSIGTVTNCYNTETVSGTNYVGGVVGYVDNNSTVIDCYNTGTVSSTNYFAGGVVSYVNSGTVTNCYNTGTVSGISNVGGVVGLNYGTITDCYYLDTCITNPTNTEGTALTDAQMRVVSNFVGFDFDTVWTMDGNPDYPYPELRGFIKESDIIRGDVDGDGEVTSDDAIRVLYYTLLPDSYTVNQTVDFDGDGFETSDDAIYLLYYTLLPDLYPLD